MSILPLKIKKGFSIDEAIALTRFCTQIYELYQYDDGGIDDEELRGIYNSIHHQQDWKFVHSIRNDRTAVRGVILKRDTGNQYVVLFRGTVVTERGALELTNFISDFDWELVSYGSNTDARVKVAKGFYEAFESVADQIKLFFKTILGKLTPKDFREIELLPVDRQFACLTALADAGRIRLDTEFQQESRKLIEQAIADEEIGNNDELKGILEFQEQKLSELTPLDGPLDIYITGHSLGGSLAKFAALALRRFFGPEAVSGVTLKAYALGSPKIGNKAFADYYNRQLEEGTVYRIENTLDFLMLIPFAPPFPLNALAGDAGLRLGNIYVGNYANVGQLHTITGIGSQSISLGTGGVIDLGFGVPYPHSYEAYLQLLQEQKQFWQTISQPLRSIFSPFLKELLQEQFEDFLEKTENDRKLNKEVSSNGSAATPIESYTTTEDKIIA
ncbi:lipase family protein [Nostoc sp. CENA67]|uniref:Lipase family protein n=1 Tax=Amazonocrinis nigriterrae CENA67 TaxID=2794033 RepID=A0A8J7HKQ9_9NOST|nr:lipase family protein [Amazonocrinis nigriterrae]MBH8561397.1 lipase family protein [Amazonocrinis nigriterrae CENA67]